MRRKGDSQQTDKPQPEIDFDSDRYPDLERVFSRIIAAPELPTGPIDRVDVRGLANGDATCRIWPARAEEPEGLYLPAEGPSE
jgi:hypothetical protein